MPDREDEAARAIGGSGGAAPPDPAGAARAERRPLSSASLSLAESLTIGIVKTDGEGLVRATNSVVRRIFHAGEGRLEGKRLVNLFEPSGRETLSTVLADVLHARRPREVDLVAATPKGPVAVRVAAKGRLDEFGNLREVAWSVRETGPGDPALSVRVHTARVEALAELGLELGRQVGPLVTRMNRALAAADRLLDPTHLPAEPDREVLRFSLTEVASGLLRLQDVFSVLERLSVDTPLKPEPVDPSVLLGRAETLLAESLRSNRARVQNAIEVPAPMVVADAGRLTEIFVNLLRNGRNAIRRRLEVETEASRRFDGVIVVESFVREPFVCLLFTNNGQPIPEAVAERIFVPTFAERVPDRAGLGLPETAALLREMGGAIRCEALGDFGTRFELTLRRAV